MHPILRTVVLNKGYKNGLFVAKNGNDDNPGTLKLPFLTINKAATVATAGKTVYIRGGTYNEKAIVANDGTAGARITFSNYKGETVIMDGTAINTSGSALFNCNGKSYITVQGIRVINADAVGIGYSAGSGYITVQNCSTYNTVNGGIAFYGCNHITIINNIVENASTGESDEALFVEITDYFEIAYNQVLNSGREGIDAVDGSNHGTIHHNTVVGSSLNTPAEGRCGIYVDAYDATQTDIEVYGNIVHDCAMGIAIAAENGGALSNVNVHHNLCYKNTTFGMAMIIAAEMGPVTDSSFYQNTTYDNGNGVDAGGGIYVSDTGAIADNISIINNIFAEYRSGSLYTPIYGSSHITPDAADFTIDHNLIQKEAGYNLYAGTNYIVADPLFVDAANADFTLQTSPTPSPAIGAGISGVNMGAF